MGDKWGGQPGNNATRTPWAKPRTDKTDTGRSPGARVAGAPPTTPSHALPPLPQAPAGLRPSATPPYSLAKNQAWAASPPLLSSIRSGCTSYPHSPWEAGHGVGSGERKLPPPSRRLLGSLGGGDGYGQGTFCFRTDSRVCTAGSYAVQAGRGGRGSILPWAQPRPAPRLGHKAQWAPVQERAWSPHMEAGPGRAGSVRAGAAPRGLGLGPSPPGAAGGLGLGGSGPAHT